MAKIQAHEGNTSLYFCPDPQKCFWEEVLLILPNAQTVLYLILVGLSGRPSLEFIRKERNDYE